MSKIIIYHDMTDLQATHYVMKVIQEGKVSNDKTQYCYLTRFTNGVCVYADVTRSGAPRFRVMAAPEEAKPCP